MKFNLTKDLTPLKEAAALKIDTEAELARGRYITAGAGQAMVYLEKERQAEAVVANPDIDPTHVALIQVDADIAGSSLFDAAVVVLTLANYWRTVSPAIEDKRMRAKAQVQIATNPAAIDAASNVQW